MTFRTILRKGEEFYKGWQVKHKMQFSNLQYMDRHTLIWDVGRSLEFADLRFAVFKKMFARPPWTFASTSLP